MPSQTIIQRRSGNSQLPTMANNNSPSPTGKLRSRRHKSTISPFDRTSFVRWAIIIVLSMSIGLIVWKPVLSVLGLRKQSAHAGGRPRFMKAGKPLEQFTDLSSSLENSDLVALYFAASWCPMSTPISLALDEAFVNSDEILTPKTNRGEKKSLSIIYVSSDETKSEFDEYLSAPNRKWNAIPYEHTEQRNQLKKHFATCAHREMEDLEIDRRHEIPTIIIIDSKTQGIITTDGVSDIKKLGSKALGRWKDKQIWLTNAKEAVTMFH